MTYSDSADDSDVDVHVFHSSNLAAASFNKRTGQATVTFLRGQTYSTDRMTPELWDALKDAPSAGRFYAAHLKDIFV